MNVPVGRMVASIRRVQRDWLFNFVYWIKSSGSGGQSSVYEIWKFKKFLNIERTCRFEYFVGVGSWHNPHQNSALVHRVYTKCYKVFRCVVFLNYISNYDATHVVTCCLCLHRRAKSKRGTRILSLQGSVSQPFSINDVFRIFKNFQKFSKIATIVIHFDACSRLLRNK